MKQKKVFSFLALLVAAIIWGTAFSAQKFAVESGVGTFLFNGARFLIGSATLAPVVFFFLRGRIRFCTTMPAAAVAGTVLFVAANLQQFGIDLTRSAGRASFLTGIYLVLVPLAAWLLFRERVRATVLVGALSAFVGLYFISFTAEGGFGLGDGLLLVACLFWTAHILVIDRMGKACDPIVFSMLQFFVCGVLSLISACFFETVSLASLGDCLGPLLYTGVLSSGIAYTCQVIGQKHTPPAVATLVLSTEALFGALSGALVNGEQMGARTLLGAGLIFLGILLSQLQISPGRKK